MENRIRQLRKQKSLTLQELSDALEEQKGIYISPDSLRKYESGERKPKIEKLEALAEFYSTSVAYLRGDDISKLANKKEELKQAFADEVKKASNFHLEITYDKSRIAEIRVTYNFGYDRTAFTVWCLQDDNYEFRELTIKLGKKIELIAEEAVELAHLLQNAGYLIDSLKRLDVDKGYEEE